MTYLRKTRLFKNTQKSDNTPYGRWVFGLLTVLMAGLLMLTACISDPGILLTVENQTSSDVTVIREHIDKNGEHSTPWDLGTVPAGQTVELQRRFIPSSVVLLKAEDPSGKVVWQQILTDEDFSKLEKVGWKMKIVISPQTDSPP